MATNTKNFMLFILTLFVIIGVGVKLKGIKTTTSQSFTITITKEGFEPGELSVPLGTSVVFINKGNNPHWVASDNHPIHELYPEFDSKKPLDSNEQWSFLFRRGGAWGYHDHLNPKFHGEIIVEADKTKQTVGPNKLTKNELPKNEVVEKVKEIVKTQGSLSSWEYFKKSGQNVIGSHDVAHYIGSFIYNEYGVDGLKKCDASFAFGCFHGVVEALIGQKGIDELTKVIDVCQTLPYFQGQITCYHGIGHGILPYYKYELPEALRLCDKLFPSTYRQYCYRGVFMENALVKSRGSESNDPQWPCNTLEEKYKSSCYGYQMIFLLNMYNDDVEKISQACSQAGRQDYIESCIRGLGNYIAQKYIKDPRQIQQLCNKARGDNAYRCQIAAAVELVFQGESYKSSKLELCDSLPHAWANECVANIDRQKSIQ